MHVFRYSSAAIAGAVAVLVTGGPAGAALNVVSVQPASNALTTPLNAPIVLNFDQPVMPSTVTIDNIRAFGKASGPVRGVFSLSNGDQTVTLTPDALFAAGESVLVSLSHNLKAADGSDLRSAGYSFLFWTRSKRANLEYVEIDEMSVRGVGGATTRLYGGVGCDLDNDGWSDITGVNEVSADLRVMLNRGDGTGLFDSFLEPPAPIDGEGSPNDVADFNNDGFADVCVANYNTGTVSVLLGDGDGTFSPRQDIDAGNIAVGVVAIDVDGDADPDIVNCNNASNNLSVSINNGAGVFGAAAFFESGGNGEYALASSDMNGDGVMDLVIGTRNGQQVVIMRGNGNATFTNSDTQPGVGLVWQINSADLDGDGDADVATANSQSNTASILLGDGAGGVGAPVTHPSDNDPVATDLGDLDGDGDLDWILSHFGEGTWLVFSNNGAGAMSFSQSFPANSNASCANVLDIDNDGDMDMILYDEIADVVTILQNPGPLASPDINGDGFVGASDLAFILCAWGPCPTPPAACPSDLNADNVVGAADLATVLGSWGPLP